ncbi:unnamed protein product [Bursaphelenchus okinawaensis]|uniref:Uncharacterized protein n=1 Tax=Bursaphelenchus okinawaensis TaxID=465554 RepID=A0A811LCU6_9BILA|nr:unnamed protein product [Bursaphelenchus okinawaensis]CAG9121567.1 unnamed protein product [Bursaphelenchus okinawaensis]
MSLPASTNHTNSTSTVTNAKPHIRLTIHKSIRCDDKPVASGYCDDGCFRWYGNFTEWYLKFEDNQSRYFELFQGYNCDQERLFFGWFRNNVCLGFRSKIVANSLKCRDSE